MKLNGFNQAPFAVYGTGILGLENQHARVFRTCILVLAKHQDQTRAQGDSALIALPLLLTNILDPGDLVEWNIILQPREGLPVEYVPLPGFIEVEDQAAGQDPTFVEGY